jgi:hypothetical protein
MNLWTIRSIRCVQKLADRNRTSAPLLALPERYRLALPERYRLALPDS